MDEIIGAEPALDAAGRAAGGVTRRRLVYAAPALAAAGLAALFFSRLGVDPSQVPSNLIGKRVPVFSLPPVQGRTLGLSSDDLLGEVSLVNVFASWCVACREEHPLLLRLKNDGSVPIHGLNYKDHGAVRFTPGGYHVMFARLAKPLVKGEKVKATLSFERAGQVTVEFPVEGLGASGPAPRTGGSMGGMKM